jgi:hypothetical protein
MTTPNSRKPWSDGDYCTLSDMLGDGYPRRSVAQRLGRSIHAVQGMARKIGIPIQRRYTVAFQCQIAADVNHRLAEIAGQRGVTRTTMARIIIELAIASPVWLNRLLDDAEIERREA